MVLAEAPLIGTDNHLPSMVELGCACLGESFLQASIKNTRNKGINSFFIKFFYQK
jgi:hypothetical protein